MFKELVQKMDTGYHCEYPKEPNDFDRRHFVDELVRTRDILEAHKNGQLSIVAAMMAIHRTK